MLRIEKNSVGARWDNFTEVISVSFYLSLFYIFSIFFLIPTYIFESIIFECGPRLYVGISLIKLKLILTNSSLHRYLRASDLQSSRCWGFISIRVTLERYYFQATNSLSLSLSF